MADGWQDDRTTFFAQLTDRSATSASMEANRYINMDDLREHKKLAMRQAA